MRKRTVNEALFLEYLDKCVSDKANIVATVTEIIRPALATIEIVDESKIEKFIEPIIREKTEDIEGTIKFLEKFVIVETTPDEVRVEMV